MVKLFEIISNHCRLADAKRDCEFESLFLRHKGQPVGFLGFPNVAGKPAEK